jgi:drug/metabolite transporter (DMT)-like permease
MNISDNLRGTLYMCLSMMAFTVNDAFMKSVTQTLPLYQTIALRGVIAVCGIGLIAAATGALRIKLTRADVRLVAVRSFADVLATVFFLTALLHMPLANLSAIMQAMPLAITLGAALLYGDQIGWRRMSAILVGFAGVLIIIRPGTEGFDRYALLGVASMACVVARDLAVRPIKSHVPSVIVALGAAVGVTLMGLIGTLWGGWAAVSPGQGLSILGAGLFLIAGYLSAVTAMRWGEIGLVAPFRYTSLLWAIVLGWVAFSDLPDFWTLIGSGIVVAAGIFTLLRERALNRALAA